MTQQWPAATRDKHEAFCLTEGWERTKTAQGQPSQHHVTCELTLPNGDRLRSRVSRPVNRTTYGPSLWAHVLRDQLKVSNEEFWNCVDSEQLPDRGAPVAPAGALPASLVNTLITVAGVPESDVRKMTKHEAVERLNLYWTTGE